jgi:hypothetical protein
MPEQNFELKAVHFDDEGKELICESGGTVTIKAGGTIVATGATVAGFAGTTLTPDNTTLVDVAGGGTTIGVKTGGVDTTQLAAGVQASLVKADNSVAGVAAGYKVARGYQASVTGTATIATGLTTVVTVVASLDDDPKVALLSAYVVSATKSASAGSIVVKCWDSAGSAATAAAKVNWVAIGT